MKVSLNPSEMLTVIGNPFLITYKFFLLAQRQRKII